MSGEPAKDGRDEVLVAWEDWRQQWRRCLEMSLTRASRSTLLRAIAKRQADFHELVVACIRRRF